MVVCGRHPPHGHALADGELCRDLDDGLLGWRRQGAHERRRPVRVGGRLDLNRVCSSLVDLVGGERVGEHEPALDREGPPLVVARREVVGWRHRLDVGTHAAGAQPPGRDHQTERARLPTVRGTSARRSRRERPPIRSRASRPCRGPRPPMAPYAAQGDRSRLDSVKSDCPNLSPSLAATPLGRGDHRRRPQRPHVRGVSRPSRTAGARARSPGAARWRVHARASIPRSGIRREPVRVRRRAARSARDRRARPETARRRGLRRRPQPVGAVPRRRILRAVAR